MPSVALMPKLTNKVLSAPISRSATRDVAVPGLVERPSTRLQVLPPFWLRHKPVWVAAYTSPVPG